MANGAFRSPIGERSVFEFFSGRPAWTIVGLVGDEQFDSVDRPMAPVVYFPSAQDPESAFSIVFRAAAPEAAIRSIREAVASVDAGPPLYGVQTLKQAMAASPAVFLRSLVMRLLVWFSIAALLLGAVGVYGVLSESVHARTQELGIGQALGATRARCCSASRRSTSRRSRSSAS